MARLFSIKVFKPNVKLGIPRFIQMQHGTLASRKRVNIAMVDTGVDNEHPGLVGKFVAGYDAVCYLHRPNMRRSRSWSERDRRFDPDDGNQHGTACIGMSSATGIDADGSQVNLWLAPDSSLVDVRIGTDAGAGHSKTTS